MEDYKILLNHINNMEDEAPKKEAKRLLNRFRPYVFDLPDKEGVELDNARMVALIHLDEILQRQVVLGLNDFQLAEYESIKKELEQATSF